MRTLEEQLKDYSRSVKYFDDFDDNEVIAFLILREVLEERKDEMTEQQKKELYSIDRKLLSYYVKNKNDKTKKEQIWVIEELSKRGILNKSKTYEHIN